MRIGQEIFTLCLAIGSEIRVVRGSLRRPETAERRLWQAVKEKAGQVMEELGLAATDEEREAPYVLLADFAACPESPQLPESMRGR